MTDDQAHQSKGSLAKGGYRERIKQFLLHPEMTPEQVALSFAIGFAMAWNPLLGLHTALILVLCFVFRRLHRPLMLLACYINNPWTMVPMASLSVLSGNLLMGRGCRPNFKVIHWEQIGLSSFVTRDGFHDMYHMLKPILTPYLLGGLVLMLLALPVGYYAMLRITIRLRALHLHLRPVKLPNMRFPKNRPEAPK
jgi:uncharacterized protein (DUF2062 family)